MAQQICLPALGSAEGGVVAEWYKHSGDWVEDAEPLVAVDVDKVTVDIPAQGAGYLDIVAQVGVEVRIGGTLAWILNKGELAPTSNR